MNYNRPHVRLLILQALEHAPGYQAHQETVLTALREQGFALNRAQLHIELAWLDENADALVDRQCDGVHIAVLTPTGSEIVQGLTTVPGVMRPFPGGRNG